MKRLLFLAIFALPLISLAQKKKEPAYFKLSPSAVFPKDGDFSLAIFAGFGGKVTRYTCIGMGAGYYKLKGYEKGVVPIGIDVNISDFEKKKVMPIFIAGFYYPIYNEKISGPQVSYTAKGRFQYQLGGGIAFSTKPKEKVMLTASFSQFSFATTSRVGVTNGKKSETLSLIIASLSFLL